MTVSEWWLEYEVEESDSKIWERGFRAGFDAAKGSK
jgi:hypothetical protein